MAQERAALLAHEWTHELVPDHQHNPAHQVPGLPAMGALTTRLQQVPLGDDPMHMLMRIGSFNVGIQLGQISALVVMVGLVAMWRPTASF